MAQKIFTIMGATGHIGHVIVEDLLKRGHAVRALGRNEKKLQQLMHKGAEIWFLDFDDVDTLTDSFKGAYAIFSMLPPAMNEARYSDYQNRVSEAICQAIKQADVARVVNLSSIGANHATGTGVIKGLHNHEKRLNDLKKFINLVHLRPGYFMENLNEFIPMIQKEGKIRYCLSPNLPIAMVATRDIGWKAADFLDSSSPISDPVFEFVGPKEVTMQRVTEVLGQALDQPDLHYEQISLDEEKKLLLGFGLQAEIVDELIEMYQAFNSGVIKTTQELKPSHHGTTTFEEFIQMLVHKTIAHA